MCYAPDWINPWVQPVFYLLIEAWNALLLLLDAIIEAGKKKNIIYKSER